MIGFPAESRDMDCDISRPLYIGAGTIIREGVVIQRGFHRGTHISTNCYLMHGAHIGHDVYLGKNVTLSPGVVLGGHTTVQAGATMGILSATHQWVTIGAYSMVGMGPMVIDDVKPGRKDIRSPARDVGKNIVGLDRAKVTDLTDYGREFEAMRTRKLCKWQ